MKKLLSIVLVVLIFISTVFISVSAESTAPSVEEVIYYGLVECKSEINISDYKLTPEEFISLFSNFVHLYPDVFHLGNRYSYSMYDSNGTTYVYALIPQYTMTQEEYSNAAKRFEHWVSDIAEKVNPNFTDLEKVLFMHEYFIAHFEYDQSYTIYDAYNFFKYKKGVCQAYTLGFTAIMKKLGIFCTSAIDDGFHHCWNIIKLGDNYYHLDTTHDDPIVYIDDEGTLMYDYCKRDHLLLSDITMKSLPLHEDWYTVGGDYKCLDNSLENKIWSEYRHPSTYCAGSWYQIFGGELLQEGSNMYYSALLYKTTINGIKELYKSFNIPAIHLGEFYYSCNYDIFSVGDIIYGGGGNYLWRYSMKNDKFETFYQTTENIYECSYAGGGKIKLLIKNADNTYRYDYYQLLIGDTDDDGVVGTKDLINLRKYILLKETDANVGFMDLNGDCFVDILDFVSMKKTIA